MPKNASVPKKWSGWEWVIKIWEIGRFEICLICLNNSSPILGDPPVSTTAIESRPIIKPILAISPLFLMFESSCWPKCTKKPGEISFTSKLWVFLKNKKKKSKLINLLNFLLKY